MTRLVLNTAVVLALALIVSACGGRTNPIGPSGTGRDAPVLEPPHSGPHSELSWEFWIGDPGCTGVCPGPNPQMLLQGDTGVYGVPTVGNTTHSLQGRVHFPAVAGHRVKFTVTFPDADGKSRQQVSEETTGNRMSGIDFLGPRFKTPSRLGTYLLELMVEEWGDDLPDGLVVLKATINIAIE